MYQKVSPNLDAQEREKEVIAFWKQNDVFAKSINNRQKGKEFSFFDGPPTANGKPHIGHILTRVMKDVIPRYKTMKGYHVLRKAGWDTHGLPVELEVEKSLGLDGKQDIERYGVEAFVKNCKTSVWQYKDMWERMSERVGYWVDMDNPYVTYDDNYIESVWWSLVQINNKGLLYKGHKIVPYCHRCGTSLSSHEVAQGYKDVEDRTVVVSFDIKDSDESIVAWTTTPWTLPSNVALCVGEHDYSLVSTNNRKYWIATELADKHFDNYTIIKTVKGSALAGKEYKPLFAEYADATSKAHYIVVDNYVTLSDGTGVVHIAPAYGEDDARIGRQYGLPFVQAVNERGEFDKGQFDKLKFKDADKHIIKELKRSNALISEIKYRHSYPHCWRCDTPLMYFARKTWFIAMSKLRDKLVHNNSTINWMPASIGIGRMSNFLENVIDWGLSRERYWGTPLPIWECDKCGSTHVVGSKQELVELGAIKGDIELHKPYVDSVQWSCKCGGVMRRTPEVIDCWYDSGAMPFAQYHYPFENKDIFAKTYPADFISEAVDQTRGWFYTLSAISTLLFDKAAFKNCIVLGHVCDKNGQKMSKHKGNVIDPWTVLDDQGADAVRWYFCIASSPWLPSRFYTDAVVESKRKFLGTLWNVYSFFVLYAEIDKFDPTKHTLDIKKLPLMDRWILSTLNVLVDKTNTNLDNCKIFESARDIADFVSNLSNWYVRRSRDRFWGGEWTSNKQSAYMTLYTVLKTLVRLIAPFVPFVAETIWQNIVSGIDSSEVISVHLAQYPESDKRLIDRQVEASMQMLLTIVENGRSARSAANIKNRQPLSTAYICTQNSNNIDSEMMDIIKDELNVEKIEFVSDDSKFVTYECKPQLKTLGAKYGARLGVVKQFLSDNANKVVEYFKKNKDKIFKKSIEDTDIELSETDVLVSIKSTDGYICAEDKGIVVALDTTLTEALVHKGYIRELTSKIQAIRKDSGLDVMDRIRIRYTAGEKLKKVIDKFASNICADTLCDSLELVKCSGQKSIDINGEKIDLLVESIK